MAFLNSGRQLGSVTSGGSNTFELTFHPKIQGNVAWPHIPVHLQTSLSIEKTLNSLPEFQVGEVITGSTNSFTATVDSITSQGTSELATCVGGGYGAPGGTAGYGGGSGGGGAPNDQQTTQGGQFISGQGNSGGIGGDRMGAGGGQGGSGGGGGAGAAGTAGGSGNATAGTGGNGLNNNFRTGSNIPYAGGGGGFGGSGAGFGGNIGAGGTGGGGTGASGDVNTGGGGGTLNAYSAVAPFIAVPSGGSGIVVVRYVTGQSGFTVTGGITNTYTDGSNYQSHTFLTTDVLTITGTGNVDALIISGGGGAGGQGGTEGYTFGGGGAGGMLVTNNTSLVTGSYVVVVGAGGAGVGGIGTDGSFGRDSGTGNLSYITPRRVLTVSSPSGTFVVGEALTGGTSGATGDVLVYT